MGTRKKVSNQNSVSLLAILCTHVVPPWILARLTRTRGSSRPIRCGATAFLTCTHPHPGSGRLKAPTNIATTPRPHRVSSLSSPFTQQCYALCPPTKFAVRIEGRRKCLEHLQGGGVVLGHPPKLRLLPLLFTFPLVGLSAAVAVLQASGWGITRGITAGE